MFSRRTIFFSVNKDALQIILYQDAFEEANPLGSAKTEHKIFAIYPHLGNLYPHSRSQLNSIQLVALCREKFFNCDRTKVFAPIVQELKELEETGFEIYPGHVVKGTLVCITGDNLGSHGLGGFTENISSSQFFCRFCEIERANLQSRTTVQNVLPLRTVQKYYACTEALDRMSEEERQKNRSVKGIMKDSVFNQLKFYHVALPGLPPCLAHDLFEGVVQYDLAMFIKHFVKVKSWLTYEELNKLIDLFPYSITDRQDKPPTLSPVGKRLGG